MFKMFKIFKAIDGCEERNIPPEIELLQIKIKALNLIIAVSIAFLFIFIPSALWKLWGTYLELSMHCHL